MATIDAYTATGTKFPRKRDTADVSKVRRTFLRFVLTGEGREAKKTDFES